MKKVAIFGVSDRARPESRTVNTGNLIHAAAGRKIIGNFEELNMNQPWTADMVERLEAECSHIVFIAANGVRVGATTSAAAEVHERMLANLERTRIPIVVLGLGAQAPMAVESPIIIPGPTVRLLKLIEERSERIAVRGAFTADVLNSIGVKNAEVIGCPSNFWHLSPHFPVGLKPVKGAKPQEVAFSYTGPRRERALIRAAIANSYDIIGQEHPFERDILAGRISNPEQLPFGSIFANDHDWDTFATHIRAHFYMYFNLDEWFAAMVPRRFCYGTRFHGNMVALQSGTKALWITHDQRTLELCEYHGLPSVPLERAAQINNLEELVELADYSKYVSWFPDRYRRLYEYLERAALPHCLPKPYEIIDGQNPGGASPIELQIASLKQMIQSQSSSIIDIKQRLDSVHFGMQRMNSLPDQQQEMIAPRTAARLAASASRNRRDMLKRNAARGVEAVSQTEPNTQYNRYPKIFSTVERLSQNGAGGVRGVRRVLSFGCSSGEEAETLATLYFNQVGDFVVGTDANEKVLEIAQASNPIPQRISYVSIGSLKNALFDVVFAMNVLCVWPLSKYVDDLSELFPFSRFERMLEQIDEMLMPGGILVVYNANYLLQDCSISERYEALKIPELDKRLQKSRLIRLFDNNSKVVHQYPNEIPVVFRKRY